MFEKIKNTIEKHKPLFIAVLILSAIIGMILAKSIFFVLGLLLHML